MRAGKLDRTIEMQAYVRTGTTPAGTPVLGWSTLATVRAELIEASTEEYLRGYGETKATARIFRIRYLPDVSSKWRVLYEGAALEIKEIKEIGRRRGLELRCSEVRT